MSNYSIRLERPDERLDARVLQIRIGDKDLITPFKTFSQSTQKGIYEFGQTFTENLLMRSVDEKTTLDNLPKKYSGHEGCINVLLPTYLDGRMSDKALEYMDDRIHPYTDIVVVPRWEGILAKNNGNTYLEENWSLSERYIGEVRRLNGKLILGNIPMNHPQSVISGLFDNYIKQGVTSFVLDYERCNTMPKRYIVRDIIKKLHEYTDEKDNYILFDVNMRRSHDYREIKPADDFLSFSNGIDIIGNYHLKGQSGEKPRYDKVFNRSQWTYEDIISKPGDRDRIKLNNHLWMNIEADAVKSTIVESGTASKLMKEKQGAQEYSSMVNQTVLDLGGIGFRCLF